LRCNKLEDGIAKTLAGPSDNLQEAMTMSGDKNNLPDDTKLFEMMNQLGMEPAGAPVPRFGHMMASAYHTCKSCGSVEECKVWLEKAKSQVQVSAPPFCLNNELLAEFLFEPLMRKE
jgi:hypothetical protein